MGKMSQKRPGKPLQQAVKAEPYPTIFGWHTARDDELSFMFQLSANGLRWFLPLGGNFSFHSKLPSSGIKQKIRTEPRNSIPTAYI
jgi:hypothetical protein